MVFRHFAAPAIFFALTSSALAHTGVGEASGFAHGFSHPLGGIDHVLAMVAVGLYAAMLGGRALWLVPAAFVSVMALGGGLGIAGYALPHAEIGIALSVIMLGLALAFRISIPALTATALVGTFAIFHGHAHGSEMPQDLSGYEYAAGFLLATALLHCAGIGPGLASAKFAERGGWRVAQAAGAAIAVTGVALLAAAI